MKEDKNIPQETARPEFTNQEQSNEAVGTAFTPINSDPKGDDQIPGTEGGDSLESLPQEEELKSKLDKDIEPSSDSLDSQTTEEQSSQVEAPGEENPEGQKAVQNQDPQKATESDTPMEDAAELEEGQKQSEPAPEVTTESPEASTTTEVEAKNETQELPVPEKEVSAGEEVKPEEASPSGQALDEASVVNESSDQATSESTESDNDEGDTTAPIEGETDQTDDTADGKTKEESDEKKPDKEVDPLVKYEQEDYQNYSKEELIKVVDQVLKGSNVLLADRVLNLIKPHYDKHRKAAKDKALEQFVADGNEAKDFDYKYDQLDHRFDADFRLIKDRKRQYYKILEQEKDQNLIIKNELLEELRNLVHSEETKISMDALKSLQSRWKAVGPVPRAQVRTLWANYNALLDLFYDQRSIYFELKELDRRKNLKAKEELCEKAEKLEQEENLKEAINQLNDLHHEYKHLGPVPKEVQEELWQRFKAASDKIYARRKEFVKHLKEEQKDNHEAKKGLVAEVRAIAAFDSDRITDWNKQTNELLAIQKRWEAIGGVPKEHAKSVNKEFWGLFKQFFQHKNQFFKKLEKQRGENLIKKQELVKKAQALKESTDWEKTAQQLKDIQQDWRNIGPVPEKQKKAIYEQFKSACDVFFDHRRGHQKELDVEYVENLKQKEAICQQLEQMAQESSGDLEAFKRLQSEFDRIGYVPSNAIRKIRKQYQTAVAHFLKEADGLEEHERQQLKFSQEFNRIKSGPDANRKLGQKEQAIRREIGKVENDISLWKNNLEFFASSKTADKLREEFNEKIDKASDHLQDLKGQLRMLRSM